MERDDIHVSARPEYEIPRSLGAFDFNNDGRTSLSEEVFAQEMTRRSFSAPVYPRSDGGFLLSFMTPLYAICLVPIALVIPFTYENAKKPWRIVGGILTMAASVGLMYLIYRLNLTPEGEVVLEFYDKVGIFIALLLSFDSLTWFGTLLPEDVRAEKVIYFLEFLAGATVTYAVWVLLPLFV